MRGVTDSIAGAFNVTGATRAVAVNISKAPQLKSHGLSGKLVHLIS